jgi:acyl carrier protein
LARPLDVLGVGAREKPGRHKRGRPGDDRRAPRGVSALENIVVTLTQEDIKEKVVKIVSEQMGVDKSEITMETSFVNDLNADSLDTVELVMEFEDEFELSIPDEEAEKIGTVGAAVEFITAAQGEK